MFELVTFYIAITLGLYLFMSKLFKQFNLPPSTSSEIISIYLMLGISVSIIVSRVFWGTTFFYIII